MDFDWTEEDRLGMSLQPGSVSIEKDSQNLLGISIGGGAPLCPCLYIVQVRLFFVLVCFGGLVITALNQKRIWGEGCPLPNDSTPGNQRGFLLVLFDILFRPADP